MANAVSSVRLKKMSISKAARAFKVPRKSLCDRVKGRVSEIRSIGRECAFSIEEESAIEDYIDYMSLHGYPLNRYDNFRTFKL